MTTNISAKGAGGWKYKHITYYYGSTIDTNRLPEEILFKIFSSKYYKKKDSQTCKTDAIFGINSSAFL